MIVLEPVAVTPATLISSTVAETEHSAWAGGATYAVGDRVIRQHRVRESLVAGNVGNAPESFPDKWLDVGPTNRWAMFDPAAGPRTTAAGSIGIDIVPVVPVASVGIVDTLASSVHVQVLSGATIVYDEILLGGGTRLLTSLPVPAGQRISVTIYPTAGLAAIGKLLIGEVLDLGVTETGPTVGITDYSRRETDDFGVTTIVERAWARRIGARTRLNTSAFDGVQKAMERLLSKPALWIASPIVQALAAYGFVKDFGANYTLRDTCFAGLTIEGLPSADRIDSGADPAIDGSSDLQVVPPVEVSDAILTYSSIAPLSDHAAWAAGTTYGAGDQVAVAADRRIYESLVAGNAGNVPSASPDKWLDVGPTSRWAMFDQALGTISSAATEIAVVLTPLTPVDAVAVLDAGGSSVRLRVEDAAGAPAFDQTLPGGGQKVWTGLPKPAGQKILVTVEPQAGVAQVGTLLIGSALGLGRTEDAPQAGLTDYSRKDTDDFGNTTVVPRGTAKRLSVRSMIATTGADDVVTRMAARRAKPSLWLATDAAEALAIYGFARDFSLTIGENTSVGAFTIEGLTKAAPSPAPPPAPTDGQSAYSIYLTNDSEQLPATYEGVITSYAAATTGVRVLYGGEDVTAQFAPVALVPGDGRNPQGLTIGGAYPDFSVTAGFDAAEDNASFLFRVTGTGAHAGVTLNKQFSLSKSKAALDGSPPPLIRLTKSQDYAKYNAANTYVGGDITFTAVRQNIPGDQTYFRIIQVSDGNVLYADTADAFGAGYGGAFGGSGGDVLVFTAYTVNELIANYGTVRVEAYRDGYAATDSVSLGKIKDGTNGLNAPLVLTQWSVNGSTGWHADFTTGDIYQRQSNDNGATWGPAVKVVGDSVVGDDGITPATIFIRSPSVPATPASDTGNPPPGWSDGPTAGAGFIWQSNSKFRDTVQLTSWSTPQRISGEAGADAIVGNLSQRIWTVQATSTGQTKPGQLNQYSVLSVKKGAVDITGDCAVTVTPGDAALVDVSYSAPSVILSRADGASWVDVGVTYQGVAVPGFPARIPISRPMDPLPPQGATSVSGSGGAAFGNSYTGANGEERPLRANASGQVTWSMAADYYAEQPSGNGTRSVTLAAALVYRAAGTSTWSYTAEVVGTQAYSRGGTEPETQNGFLSVEDAALSGLTPNGDYVFSYATRRTNGTAVAPNGGVFFTVKQ